MKARLKNIYTLLLYRKFRFFFLYIIEHVLELGFVDAVGGGGGGGGDAGFEPKIRRKNPGCGAGVASFLVESVF